MAKGEGPVVLQPRPIVGTFPTPPPSDDPSYDGTIAALTPTSVTPSSSAWRPPRSPRPPPLPPQSPRPANRNAGEVAAGSAGADAAVTISEIRDPDGLGESGSGGGSAAETSGRGGDDGITAYPPAFHAYRAACGQSHTVLVSTAGEAWVCGRNRSGQLGLDPVVVSQTFSPVRIPSPSSDDDGASRVGSGDRGSASRVRVVQAAAGRAHTILLRSNGCVLGFGSDEFGALGCSTQAEPGGIPEVVEVEVEGGTKIVPAVAAVDNEGVDRGSVSMHWKPREISALKEQWVASVSAGGEQSFALVVGRTPTPPQGQEEKKESDAEVASSVPSGSGKDIATGVSTETESVPGVGSDVLRAAAATATGTAAGTSTATETTTPAAGGSSGSGGNSSALIWRQGSEAMNLRRRFSLPPALKMRTAAEFLALIEQARGVGTGVPGGAGQEYEFAGKAAEMAVLEVSGWVSGGWSESTERFMVVCFGGGEGGAAPVVTRNALCPFIGVFGYVNVLKLHFLWQNIFLGFFCCLCCCILIP